MSAVDPLFAQWLQAEADWAVRADAPTVQRWGDSAVTTSRATGLATLAGAQAQADRDLAFFSRGPFAIDMHQLAGTDWQRELGRVVTLTIDQLGYDAGVDVFVLEVEASRQTGLSSVTVIRPLGSVT